jgi:hypothetical protein
MNGLSMNFLLTCYIIKQILNITQVGDVSKSFYSKCVVEQVLRFWLRIFEYVLDANANLYIVGKVPY